MYVICEGKGTEPAYFSFFESLSSNLQVIIIPPSEGTDPLKLMELAKWLFLADDARYTLKYHYGDTVWFVIDTDTWQQEGKIAPLRKFCEEQNDQILEQFDEVKHYRAWNVAQSNPSFEIWLYYHFYSERPEQSEVASHASFKEFVSKSVTGGFDFSRHPVYLEDAIRNAESCFVKDEDGMSGLYTTEMSMLGREILPFTMTELRKLRNKL